MKARVVFAMRWTAEISLSPCHFSPKNRPQIPPCLQREKARPATLGRIKTPPAIKPVIPRPYALMWKGTPIICGNYSPKRIKVLKISTWLSGRDTTTRRKNTPRADLFSGFFYAWSHCYLRYG